MAAKAPWWPWRRSRPAPATPPAAAPDSRWHGLPPIQRTVDEIAPTAGLDEFSSSLTTAQNPGFLAPVGALSTDHVGTLPLLGGADRPAASGRTEPVVPQPRTWQPALNLPQRILPAPASVQRSPDVAGSSLPAAPDPTAVMPVTGSAPLTLAPNPAERREVPVVQELSADPSPMADDRAAGAESVISVAAHDIPVAPTPPVQRSTSTERPAAVPSPPPLRPVQRAQEPPSAPTEAVRTDPRPDREQVVAQRVPMTTPAPAPRPEPPVVTATPAPAEPRQVVTATIPPPAEPRPVIPRPEPAAVDEAEIPDTSAPGEPSDESVPQIQRSTPAESIVWFAPDDPVTLRKPAQPPASDRSVSATHPSPSVPVQRVTVPPSPITVEPPRSVPIPVAAEHPPTQPPLQRLVSVPEHSTPAEPPTGLARPAPPVPHVQRAEPGHSVATVPAQPVQRTPAAIEPEFSPAPAPVRLETVDELPVRHHPAPVAGPTTTAPVAAVQRAVTPALQRVAEHVAPKGAKLVVLPALRPETAPEPSDTGPSPATPAIPSAPASLSRIVESSRPMSLQRMFEHTATPLTHHEPAPPAAAVLPERSATVSENGGYTEVTFPQYTVQRDAESPESDSSAEQSAAAETPSGTATATPPPSAPAAATPGGTNIDELVNRLYDPLAARLRSELWLDRERAGVLMDLRR
jgi:hypothetical protein